MARKVLLTDKLFPPTIDTSSSLPPDEAFSQAMADVQPLGSPKIVRRKNGPQGPRRLGEEGREGIRLLDQFVRGESEFDWSFHPEYQEGGPESRNAALLKKLRRGGFSVRAELDLHGMTQEEALEALERFLFECSQKNLLCVRIVHGKGNNSANNVGVLRKRIPQWLSMKRLSRLLVAFASAPPTDGGLGATYILLRRRPGGRRTSSR